MSDEAAGEVDCTGGWSLGDAAGAALAAVTLLVVFVVFVVSIIVVIGRGVDHSVDCSLVAVHLAELDFGSSDWLLQC